MEVNEEQKGCKSCYKHFCCQFRLRTRELSIDQPKTVLDGYYTNQNCVGWLVLPEKKRSSLVLPIGLERQIAYVYRTLQIQLALNSEGYECCQVSKYMVSPWKILVISKSSRTSVLFSRCNHLLLCRTPGHTVSSFQSKLHII